MIIIIKYMYISGIWFSHYNYVRVLCWSMRFGMCFIEDSNLELEMLNCLINFELSKFQFVFVY